MRGWSNVYSVALLQGGWKYRNTAALAQGLGRTIWRVFLPVDCDIDTGGGGGGGWAVKCCCRQAHTKDPTSGHHGVANVCKALSCIAAKRPLVLVIDHRTLVFGPHRYQRFAGFCDFGHGGPAVDSLAKDTHFLTTSSATCIGRSWLERHFPDSSLTETFNSPIVPSRRRLYSGHSIRTVLMSPKAWRPNPMPARSAEGAPSTIFSAVFISSKWTHSICLAAKFTGRSPVYAPALSQTPPKPSSRPRSASKPSDKRTPHPGATTSEIKPFSLLTVSVCVGRELAPSRTSFSRSNPYRPGGMVRVSFAPPPLQCFSKKTSPPVRCCTTPP